jgi:hypothetical protein
MASMRAPLLALILIVGCKSGGGTPPPNDEPMPLPPTGEEARQSANQATDDSVRVIGLDPDHGPADRATAVRIRGANFRLGGGMKVKFGRVEAEVLRSSDDEIAVQVPPGNAGDVVDVVVMFEQAGEMVLRGAYTFDNAAP